MSCSAPLGLRADVAIAWGLLLLAGRLLIAAFGAALELTRVGARLSGRPREERAQSR